VGVLEEAERLLRAAPSGMVTFLSMVANNHLIYVLLARRKLDEARAQIEARIQSARRVGGQAATMHEASARSILGEIALLGGDPAAAEREVLAALDGGLRMVPLDPPLALSVLALARIALGRPAEALAAAREALEALPVTGTKCFRQADIFLAHARALHAAGEIKAARTAILKARTRVLSLADRIDDPAMKRSYLEQVSENAATLALAAEWLGEPGA
jgi:hypothetical protein